MTILIHEYHDLEERASKHLRKWKVCHILVFILAAICGILNYTFLQNSMELIDGNCILFPKSLEFHMVEIPNCNSHVKNRTDKYIQGHRVGAENEELIENNHNETNTDMGEKIISESMSEDVETKSVDNATIVLGNVTHCLMLDTSRSVFGVQGCEYTEYMPLLSTVMAIVWTVMFIICPGGGRSKAGLVQPWRILAPALLFSLVMVGLTGHNFTTTSSGIAAFCQEFQQYTHDGMCESASQFLERGWNASLGLGGRAAAARAAAAAAWVAWAAGAALLLARCLTGADFQLRRTDVLVKDPQKKLLPYLVPLSQSSARSSGRSQSKRDMSTRSDPTTVTTELVTATVEIQPDSSLSPESEKAFGIGDDIEMSEKVPHEENEDKSVILK